MGDDILARLRRYNKDMSISFSDNIYNETLIILKQFIMKLCFEMCNQNLVTLGVQSPERYELSVTHSELIKELNYNFINVFVCYT